ncbi:DUF1559 domain-containing protein [Pirellulaceae bacterium SH449]
MMRWTKKFAGLSSLGVVWLTMATCGIGQETGTKKYVFTQETIPFGVDEQVKKRSLDDIRSQLKASSSKPTAADPQSSGGAMGGMGGGYGGMGEGGYGGMGAVPTEKQLLAQLIQRLRQRLNTPSDDREKTTKQLRAALQQYFDADMAERVKEFDKVKARVQEMEDKLQKRLDSEVDIIELQLKQMLHKADGLDFNISGSGMGRDGGYGSGPGGGMGMGPGGGMGPDGSYGSGYGGEDGGYGGGMGGYGGMGMGGPSASAADFFIGYDVMFGLTRVQRLDLNELTDDDPLKQYMEFAKAAVKAKPETDKEKLKQILLAFHNFESFFKHLPRSENRMTAGAPPHSWRVAILPLLGYVDLYNEYQFDQPWDSEQNLKVAAKMPDIYRSTATGSRDTTPFKMLVGGGALDSGVAPPSFRNITDGISNTIALMAFEDEVVWTKPEDVNYGSVMFEGLPSRAASKLIGMADGFVREEPDINPAMITRAGGEVIEPAPNR